MKILSLLFLVATPILSHAEAIVTTRCENPNAPNQGVIELWLEGRAGVSYDRPGVPNFDGWSGGEFIGSEVVMAERSDYILLVNLTKMQASVFMRSTGELAGVLACTRP